jgi:hypothetical protein
MNEKLSDTQKRALLQAEIQKLKGAGMTHDRAFAVAYEGHPEWRPVEPLAGQRRAGQIANANGGPGEVERSAEIQKLVAAYMKSHPAATYDVAFGAVLRDPANKPLADALHKPGPAPANLWRRTHADGHTPPSKYPQHEGVNLRPAAYTKPERAPEDADAVAKLSTLREQLRLFDRKIATLQDDQLRDGDRHGRDLGEAEHATAELLIEYGRPTLEGIYHEARAAFEPFYKDPARLELAMQRNDKAMSLKAYLTNAGAGPVNERPKRLLSILDRLIAGSDMGWTWQTAPAPAAPAPEATPEPATPATKSPGRVPRQAQAVAA